MKNSKNFVLKNITVSVNDKPILQSINLSIEPGTTHAIMGPNGSGKSTLAYALMGHPNYETNGSIILDDSKLTSLSPDQRAKKGLFLAFQHPFEIPGVSVSSFLKEAYCAISGKTIPVPEFHELLSYRMKQLNIDISFASRGLNDCFSGGEKKRLEILQLLLLQPRIVILDEIDSGLDIDALKIVAHGIKLAQQENKEMSIILITHYQRILRYVRPDYVHVLCDGLIVASGDATLADTLEKKGYDVFKKLSQQAQL